MTLEQLDRVLLIGAGVLLVSIGAVRVATRTGLPSLLAYLLLGLVLGSEQVGLGFTDAELARALGTAALVVILVEGGITTSWPTIRPSMAAAVSLATLGVGVSLLVTALGAWLLLDVDWQLALLLGAIVSSTDAAAVFSVLRRLPLPPRLAGLLEAESGLNDAPAVLLVVALSTARLDEINPLLLVVVIAFELVAGAAIGVAVGWLGARLMRQAALPSSGLYPLAAFGFGVLGYASAATVHASGFLAAYLAALVLGNSHLPHRPAVRSFAEGLGWLAQIGMFVMLGLLATPANLPAAVVPAVGVGLVLLLVARPLSVLVSLLPFRTPWRHQAFLSWAGLRGAVPIVLATVPVVEDVPGSGSLFDVVFLLVVIFTLVQGPSLPWVAQRLGVAVPAGPRDIELESAPLESLRAELLELTIPPGSHLHGVEVFELRLPSPAAVTLVIREGKAFVPDRYTVLAEGDELLVVTTPPVRAQVEGRLRAVSRRGKLARWFGEDGGQGGAAGGRPDSEGGTSTIG